MAGENDTSAEWELSKENVQPLRHGRKVTSLSAALQPLSGDQLSKIREQRQAFEIELRTYKGDDPLDIWYNYIKWTEENYPKGGKDGHMMSLLEKCVIVFKEEEKYKNDQRYLEVWIKFASLSSDPLEAYAFLYDQGIGCELAALYEAWTWELEQVGNTKKADALYQEGLNRRAFPVDRLERSYREFQARTVRQATADLADVTMNDPLVEERVAFGALKGRGKHQTVGSVRTGAALQSHRPGLSLKTPALQQRGQKFQIFNDENQMPSSSVPPQTGEWVTVPTRAVTHTENDQEAGAWRKAKVSQKSTGVVPIASVSSYSRPTFTVHIDPDADQHMVTPMKLPEFGNAVLSARKPGKEQTTLQHLNQIAEQDPSLVPMYCKNLVYNGVEEFQFEELRAAKWKKRQEDIQRREEIRRLEEDRAAFQEEVKRQMEAHRQRELELQRKHEEIIAQISSGMAAFNSERVSNSSSEGVTNASLSDHSGQVGANVSIRKKGPIPAAPITNTVHPHPYKTSEQSITKHLNFDDLTLHNRGSKSSGNPDDAPPQGASLLNNSSHTPNMSASAHLTNSGKSSGRSFTLSHTPDSASSFGQLNRQTPSRCNSSGRDIYFIWKPGNKPRLLTAVGKPQKMDTSASATSGAFGGEGVPFKIFSENNATRTSTGLRAPFVHNTDSDVENRVPSGVNHQPKRRALAGILQPPQEPPILSTADFYERTQEQEEHMDGLEFSNLHYRDDITMAPLGSQSDFAAAARLASTPFTHVSEGKQKHAVQQGSVNKIDLEEAGVENVESVVSQQSEDVDSYINGVAVNKEKSGLSPIMELSEDDVKSMTASSNQTNHASHMETKPGRDKQLPVTIPEAEMSNSKSPLNQSCHVIDTSGYLATEDKTEALSVSIAIDPRDPFDHHTIKRFLSCLSEPVSSYPGYFSMEGKMPEIKLVFNLGNDMYTVKKKLGEGGFAKVLLIQKFNYDDPGNMDEDDVCVAKIQSPPNPWEFYICSTVQKRLARLSSPVDVSLSMMSIDAAYFYEDYSCLLNEPHENGTLLDLVNMYRGTPLIMSELEPFAMFITIELLHMIEQLHRCQIIHGDIKPDNFLVRNFVPKLSGSDVRSVFGTSTQMLKLIDFGQSIDMSLYPPGTTFTAKVHTSGFQCIEMKTDQPWTYQTDLFGLIGTIHVVVFGEYMNIFQEGGKWRVTSKFSRKWNATLWKDFFDALLNIPSCSELPDLSYFRRQFEEYFVSSLVTAYNDITKKLCFPLSYSSRD
ncbi:mitotic checkpoint serine/threonine-protein kinase BUB1-like [Liolophura sinensis]|uniref:mitotic checkpoint serine/threonine-protein kinase BUB1-like n=1 Tax=Liolophura sinensis TaxID=3198878 RepID=UPI00315803CC